MKPTIPSVACMHLPLEVLAIIVIDLSSEACSHARDIIDHCAVLVYVRVLENTVGGATWIPDRSRSSLRVTERADCHKVSRSTVVGVIKLDIRCYLTPRRPSLVCAEVTCSSHAVLTLSILTGAARCPARNGNSGRPTHRDPGDRRLTRVMWGVGPRVGHVEVPPRVRHPEVKRIAEWPYRLANDLTLNVDPCSHRGAINPCGRRRWRVSCAYISSSLIHRISRRRRGSGGSCSKPESNQNCSQGNQADTQHKQTSNILMVCHVGPFWSAACRFLGSTYR